MKTLTETNVRIQHEDIAELGKRMWEIDGRPVGRDLDYWLRAERELLATRESAGRTMVSPGKTIRL
jgi:hypothetical protein